MAQDVKMVLKVDLQCSKCYKKVQKVLCKFLEITDREFDEKANKVTIKVSCCNPEKLRDKIYCKGGKSIKCIEIVKPKPPSKPPQEPQKPPPPPPPPPPPCCCPPRQCCCPPRRCCCPPPPCCDAYYWCYCGGKRCCYGPRCFCEENPASCRVM